MTSILQNRSTQRTSVNLFWLLAERVVRLTLGLLVYGYFYRYLGPEELGNYNFALSVVTIMLPIVTLGISDLIVRELVVRPDDRHKILGSAAILRFVLAIIALSISTFVILSLDRMELLPLVLAFSLGYLFRTSEVIEFNFNSKLQPKRPAKSRSIAYLVVILLIALAVYKEASPLAFALLYSFEFFLGGMFVLVSYLKDQTGERKRWKVDTQEIKNFWVKGLPYFLAASATSVYMKIDQLMVYQLLSEADLGYYSSAVKISETWNFVPLAVMTVLFPSIVRMYSSNKEKYESRLQLAYDVLMWGGIVISLIITIFSKDLINLLYGDLFAPAAQTLSIHIWSMVAIFVGAVVSQQLITEDNQIITLYRTIIGAIANVILNILLIPRMGIVGAAVATVISYSMVTIFANIFFKNSRQIFIMIARSANPISAFIRIKNYVQELSQ